MPHAHYKLFKPFGYLSQFRNNQDRRRNKKLLGELYNFREGTMAIGRLDHDSEGLLLLTTDGKMSEEIRSKKVEKEYWVQVDGLITEKAIAALGSGVGITVSKVQYTTLPCEVRRFSQLPELPARAKPVRDDRHGPSSWVAITLTEGKFRQVRKMTAAVGFPTLRLVRVRIGDQHLADMQPGEVVSIELGQNQLPNR